MPQIINGKRFAATVGTFDGVHLGHRRVLDTLKKAAAERDLSPLAITFDQHPLALIDPDRTPPAIMSTELKTRRINEEGVNTFILDFTPSTARESAADWMQNLHERHGVDCIVIGYDNTFGHDGRSISPDGYIALGKEMGIDVIVADEIEGISSSAIRRLIAAGKIEEANSMLGQPFTLDGVVEVGDRIGRTLGVPTANLRLKGADQRVLPPFGVYASEVVLPDGRRLAGVTNIGIRPSVSEIADTPTPRIETHILDYDGPELYGEPLLVSLLKYMRPEQKFSGLEALKERLESDIAERFALSNITLSNK